MSAATDKADQASVTKEQGCRQHAYKGHFWYCIDDLLHRCFQLQTLIGVDAATDKASVTQQQGCTQHAHRGHLCCCSDELLQRCVQLQNFIGVDAAIDKADLSICDRAAGLQAACTHRSHVVLH